MLGGRAWPSAPPHHPPPTHTHARQRTGSRSRLPIPVRDLGPGSRLSISDPDPGSRSRIPIPALDLGSRPRPSISAPDLSPRSPGRVAIPAWAWLPHVSDPRSVPVRCGDTPGGRPGLLGAGVLAPGCDGGACARPVGPPGPGLAGRHRAAATNHVTARPSSGYSAHGSVYDIDPRSRAGQSFARAAQKPPHGSRSPIA
eukprot:1098467-Prymnesium_polylepis.1